MRASALAPLALFLGLIAPLAHAADAPRDIKGLYLMTDYPAITVRPGTTSNIPLRLQNYGLGPEQYQLAVTGVPNGWTATILGGGQPVAAAMPAPDSSVSLQLRLDVPANAGLTAQTLVLVLYFTVPDQQLSYLWYNVIGCIVCVLVSAVIQLASGPQARVAVT